MSRVKKQLLCNDGVTLVFEVCDKSYNIMTGCAQFNLNKGLIVFSVELSNKI